MPRGRKKVPPNKEKLLEVLFGGWLNQWVDAGGLYGIINLDEVGKEGIGLILISPFQCVKCEQVFLRDGQAEGNLCNNCQKEKTTESK